MTGIFVYALGKAIANIEDAQDRYKRDYDKKHHTTNVRMCDQYSILHAFVEQKALFINIFNFNAGFTTWNKGIGAEFSPR